METTLAIKTELVKTWEELVRSVIASTPKVLAGLILILAALLVAKVIERLLRALLSRIGTDELISRMGIDQALRRIGITRSFSAFLPRVIYFLLLFLFARTAADSLGLVAVSETIGSFLAFVPNLISAILILLLGSLAGQFAGRAVTQAAKGSGLDVGPSLGSAVSGLILFVAAIMAVGQLHIDTEIVRIVTFCVLSGLALAFGLSFGLGTRQVTQSILAGFYARRIFDIGKELEVRGEKGVLKAFTPTMTILEHGGKTLAIDNKVFLDEMVKQDS